MTKKKLEALGEMVYRAALNSAIEDFILQNPDSLKKTHEEIRQIAIQDLEKALANEDIKFAVTIDHTETILREARSNKRRGYLEISAFWYATYFEHKINFLIHLASKRLKLSADTCQALLRKPALEDKCTWILEVLKIDKVPASHLKNIKCIGELRNRYIHYKWNHLDDDLEYKDKDRILLKNAEKTVRYILSFEERTLFKGARKKAQLPIKKSSPRKLKGSE